MRLVVIGNGVAGMEAALQLRARDETAEITIVSEESDNFFSRTALMYVLVGQLSHKDIEPLERDVYERLRFTRIRARAVSINRVEKRVVLSNSEQLPYDRLLLAVGSSARRGDFWPGRELAGIGHFVTLSDLAWLEEETQQASVPPPVHASAHVEHSDVSSPYFPHVSARSKDGQLAKTVAIIGGGLIGVEVAETLLAMKIKPIFLIRSEWFWPIALDDNEAQFISKRLVEHGVDVRLAHNVTGFTGEDGVVGAVSTDHGDIDVDAVVIAIGVVPNTKWLANSGIELDKAGGIVVDEGLQTSDEHIWAAGDCASVLWYDGSRRCENLWYTGRDQGRVVARSMLGDSVVYKRGTWYNSAKLMDIEYTTAGLVGAELPGEEQWYHEETGVVHSTLRVVHRDGQVVGINALGRRWDHSVWIQWIEHRRSLKWVLDHINISRFDTEFVPALTLPKGQ